MLAPKHKVKRNGISVISQILALLLFSSGALASSYRTVTPGAVKGDVGTQGLFPP